MKKLKIISIAVLALSINSCRKDYLYVAPVIPPPANVSWATDVYPMIKAHGGCGCHNSGSTPPKFSDAAAAFTAIQGNAISGAPYINTASPETSPFYLAFTPQYPQSATNYMPKGSTNKLTANELSTLAAWIQQGAQNN